MEEKDYDEILRKVSAIEHVTSAYICSRAGAFTTGITPKLADRSMYSAITSLAYGTAEQVGHEMNDDLQYVSLNFTQSRLLIVSLGPRNLMGILIDDKGDPDKVLADVQKMVFE